MVIPEGYKKTEIGIIPEDWDVVPLLEKCQLINGLTYHPTNVKPYGILVLRSSNIQNDDFAFTDNVFVEIEVSDNLLIKSEDILICVRNGSSSLIGKCAMASKNYNATFGAFMAVLRGNNNGYIYQLLLQKTIQKAITKNSDSAINQITNGDLKKVQIPFPTAKKERDTIVSYLSDLDILIKGLNRLITKKKNIKQGAMQELLTGKRRLPGFDEEWITINFIKKSKVKARIGWQGLKKSEYLDSGYAYLVTGTDFYNGAISWNTCHFVEKERYDIDRNIQIKNNDLLITKDGSLGKTALVTGLEYPATLNSGIFVVRPLNKSYVPAFVYYILSSFVFREYLERLSVGSTIVHLYQKDLDKFEIMIPPTEKEQVAIAEVLSDMDKEIEELEKKLTKYRNLKQGMMSELLTGHIRLTEKEDA